MLFQHAKTLERTRTLLGNNPLEVTANGANPTFALSFFTNWGFNDKLKLAGLDQRSLNNLFLRLCAEGAAAVIISILLNKLILIPVLVFLFAGAEYILVQLSIDKRARLFEGDYTALLLSLASGIKTGVDPLVALGKSEVLFSETSLVRAEVQKFRENIERGASENIAIRQFASTIAHPDIDLFRTAFILARKEGASLSLCLQRLARVTRQRQSFRRKVKSAVAMQKLSAFGIAACAIAMGFIQFAANPEGVINAFNDPIGFKVMVTGVVFICIGVVWLLQMARG